MGNAHLKTQQLINAPIVKLSCIKIVFALDNVQTVRNVLIKMTKFSHVLQSATQKLNYTKIANAHFNAPDAF